VKLLRSVVLLVLLAAACGKVGDPKPPIVRIPQSVNDLKVVQSGYHVTLFWTNPAKYVDNNPATDLSSVRIKRNGVEVLIPAGPAGQAQSQDIPISNDDLEKDLLFTVQVTSQRGKSSEESNMVQIRPRDVPGIPRTITFLVDRRSITLDWQAPERNANLADGYLVRRSDRPDAVFVQKTQFKDTQYEDGMTYKYTVTAVRVAAERIPGLGSVSVDVLAKDEKGPAPPTGLRIQPFDPGMLLEWDASPEEDLKAYLIYRSDQPDLPIYSDRANVYHDQSYRPGLSYELEAEDVFDNKSKRTPPKMP
jgi:fibronectin type 3 domain-containing protein